MRFGHAISRQIAEPFVFVLELCSDDGAGTEVKAGQVVLHTVVAEDGLVAGRPLKTEALIKALAVVASDEIVAGLPRINTPVIGIIFGGGPEVTVKRVAIDVIVKRIIQSDSGIFMLFIGVVVLVKGIICDFQIGGIIQGYSGMKVIVTGSGGISFFLIKKMVVYDFCPGICAHNVVV